MASLVTPFSKLVHCAQIV